MHKNVVPFTLSAAGIVAIAGAIVIAAGVPSSAAPKTGAPAVAAAGSPEQLVSIIKFSDNTKNVGNNLDTIQVLAPRACSTEATRHYLRVAKVAAKDPAQQANADKWTKVYLYSPLQHGLPGPLSVFGQESFQQTSDRLAVPLVPGTWDIELNCTNNLGTTIYDTFTGTFTMNTTTSWTGYSEGEAGSPSPSGTGTTSTSATTSSATSTGTDTETSIADETTTTSTTGEGQLADTGASAVLLGTAGLGLLGAGGTLLVMRRRQDADAV